MSLATHRTQASAARKRGGGLARRYLLASLLLGRHPRHTGGETKSLCRAAAGITSDLPSACECLVYPTKGVRQAQESSLSLRSPSPPAAQLVKGYETSSRQAGDQGTPELDARFLCLVQIVVAAVVITPGRQDTFVAPVDGHRDHPARLGIRPAALDGDCVVIVLQELAGVAVHSILLMGAPILAKKSVIVPAEAMDAKEAA